MTVHPYQADPNLNYIFMTCRACIQLPLDVAEIDSSIDIPMLKKKLLFHLAALDNGRNPDIGTLKKYRGEIFLECCAEIFKGKFLCYVNKVLFEMVKTALKKTYLGGTTTTALQNEVATYQKMYCDKWNQVMINQLVNEFYTHSSSK